MKKVLFVANHKGFSKFNAPYMAWFKKEGMASRQCLSPGIETGEVDRQFDIDIQRNPFSIKNFRAYRQLKQIISDGNYDIIHVHTPMGAALGRLAARKAREKGTKIIYTAHGFHFFKGAPIKNWIIYYTIERFLSKFTDILVTINEEDYKIAVEKKLSLGAVFQIDGVGVDLQRFQPMSEIDKFNKRQELGLSSSDFVALYTAQFIHRKNHVFIISCLPKATKLIPNLKVVFAGSGETMAECKQLAEELNVSEHIKFLGGRSDIPALCGMADIHISASKQEGQGIGNIEAMSTGCPLLISNIRGHSDVCQQERNGFLFDLNSKDDFIEKLNLLYTNKNLFSKISENNIIESSKYSVDREVEAMAKIYKQLF